MQIMLIVRWLRNHPLQVGVAAFWIWVVLLARAYMDITDLTFTELTNQLEAQFSNEWYGPLLYTLVYVLRPLILFPASLLAILAGNIWGLGLGLVYGLFAGTLSSLIPYIFGRWFSSKNPDEISTENGSRLRRFTRLLQENPFQAVLTMRLLYLPYDLVSVFVGGLRVPFAAFFLATSIGNIGGTLSFVAIGASIEGDITAGEVSFNPLILLFSVVILIVSFGVSNVVKRRQAVDASSKDNPAQHTITENN